jgi:glutamate synthase domain-containing protein 3
MHGFLIALIESAFSDQNRERALQVMTKLLHQPHSGKMRKSCFHHLINQSIENLLSEIGHHPTPRYVYLSKEKERAPAAEESQILVIDARGYPAEGPHSLALEIVGMYQRGFRKMILYHCQGQRFIGNGLGANTHGLSLDIYGSSGDYLASGVDGAIIHVHGSAQDQVAQIMKSGTLVIHGDVGQTFMYGAKGGSAFIRGNAAGRPLINAVGKPHVVINGTCLDYLAESFMAGDPLNGGGFVIVNGLAFDQEGNIIDQETPYPGNNLFSLGSGGAVYLRDPARVITEEQLNGGKLSELEQRDWELILPFLKENEGLFHIPVSRLLEYKQQTLDFRQAYRKVSPAPIRALNQEEAWVKER